jgi:NAD-dependent SIR2 family protein deacetylase
MEGDDGHLYCDGCGKPSPWVEVFVENGAEIDLCPDCVKLRNIDLWDREFEGLRGG